MPFPRQQIQIVGNIGKEPEARYTASGQMVLGFSLAATREYEQGGEKVKETTWFQVEVWGKVAEQCHGLIHKGQQVMVIGRMKPSKETGGPRIWTRQDGSAGASFEVSATEIWLSVFSSSQSEPRYVPEGNQEEDIPF